MKVKSIKFNKHKINDGILWLKDNKNLFVEGKSLSITHSSELTLLDLKSLVDATSGVIPEDTHVVVEMNANSDNQDGFELSII
jgi:hypothetical protein